MNTPIYVILFLNILTFIVYGVDKLKARRGSWRVSEFTLLMLAIAGGSFGAWLGMHLFHHKTKHAKFKYGIPIIMALQFAFVVAIAIYKTHLTI